MTRGFFGWGFLPLTARQSQSALVGKLAAVTALIVAAALVVLGLDLGGLLLPIDHKASDGLFYLRAKFGLQEKLPPTPLALVVVDNRTFDDEIFQSRPQVLWHEYFSTIIVGLAEAGAKVIGLDFLLPAKPWDHLFPDYSRTWLKAFGLARHKGTPVVTGLTDIAGERRAPDPRYMQIIGLEHFGSFNLTTDQDDFIRRQRLFYPSVDNPADGLYSLAFVLARVYQPGLTLPEDEIFIDYDTRPDPFPVYSMSDIHRRILAGDWAYLRQCFGGRIVLIGETDTGTQDRHATPLYYLTRDVLRNTPGVEIHAHTIRTLLNGRFFKVAPWGGRLAVYLGLVFLVSILTVFGPTRWLWLFTPALGLAYGGLALYAFSGYLILPLAGGWLSLAVGQVLSFSYRHLVADREKRKIRRVFQRYLPPRVVEEILATHDRDSLLGESKRLCLMFSDIRGFTSYSENKAPAEVVGRLNEYFEAMSTIIMAEGGVVDKFLGDGIMAFFGAFNQNRSPSLSGARAALRMLEGLAGLNQRWAAAGEETFRIGIGLHTGVVKIGNIGSETKMEYTVIGDAVNLASRLQDKTKELEEEIVMSEDVFRDLGDSAVAEDRGFEDIKGRSQSRVYALKGLKGEL
jgi:adenylate cyclase